MDETEIIAIEQALRSSLRHVEAPEGFGQRVQARLAEREANRRGRTAPHLAAGGFLGRSRRVGWGVAVAAMLALSAGVNVAHLRLQRQRAVAAQVQVDYAMKLTTHAMDEVEMGVNRSPAGRFTQLLNEPQR